MEIDVKSRIKEYLKTKGANPSKIAARYSVNQKTLSSQINGATTLSVSTILLILDMLPEPTPLKTASTSRQIPVLNQVYGM